MIFTVPVWGSEVANSKTKIHITNTASEVMWLIHIITIEIHSYIIAIKMTLSCEIEDFVETHVLGVCDTRYQVSYHDMAYCHTFAPTLVSCHCDRKCKDRCAIRMHH